MEENKIEIIPNFFQGLKIKFLFFKLERKRKNIEKFLFDMDEGTIALPSSIFHQHMILMQERAEFLAYLYKIFESKISELKEECYKFSRLKFDIETRKIFVIKETESDENESLENTTMH